MNKTEISPLRKMITVIRVLLGTAAGKYPLFFVLEVFKTVIGAAQPFIAVFLSPLIVDELIGDRDLHKLLLYTGGLILGEFVANTLSQIATTKLSKYQERLDNHFNILVGKRSMEMDFQLTEDKAALDQIEKARTGMSWYSGGAYGVSEQLFSLIGNFIKAAGLVTVIVLQAPLLLLVMAVYILLNAFLTVKRNGIEVTAWGRLSRENRLFGYFGWTIVDPRFGKDIRLYAAKDLMVDMWKQFSKRSNDHWKWQADHTIGYSMGQNLLSAFRSLFAYFYVGYLAIRGAFSIGTFTQLIQSEGLLDNAIGSMVTSVVELFKRSNYAYEYVLFMEYPAAIPKGDVPIEAVPHTIEFRNVSFAYPGTDKKVLDRISTTVRPGEHLSIVGLNGAGKTTLMKLLCRLYDPTEGEILVDGRNIMEYDYDSYMKQFAPVFQDFKLFALTIGENIAFEAGTDPTEEDQRMIDGLAERVGLTEMTEKLQRGTRTPVFKFFDENGVEPSGGEKQKMAIARALCKNSPVVILDEPTAALDPMAEYEIYRHFHSLVGDKTAFYISHRLSSCRFCDRIIVLRDGHIVENGSHDELVRIPGGIYAEMFEAQAKYYR